MPADHLRSSTGRVPGVPPTPVPSPLSVRGLAPVAPATNNTQSLSRRRSLSHKLSRRGRRAVRASRLPGPISLATIPEEEDGHERSGEVVQAKSSFESAVVKGRGTSSVELVTGGPGVAAFPFDVGRRLGGFLGAASPGPREEEEGAAADGGRQEGGHLGGLPNHYEEEAEAAWGGWDEEEEGDDRWDTQRYRVVGKRNCG